MIENNKLFAEFLGRTGKASKLLYAFKNLEYNGQIWFNDSELRFHKDWNWLMEVVKKVREIDQKAKGDFKSKLLHWQRNNKTIFDMSILEGKEYVYSGCLDFIKWYNQQEN